MTTRQARKIALQVAADSLHSKATQGFFREKIGLEHGPEKTDKIIVALIELSTSLRRQADWIRE